MFNENERKKGPKSLFCSRFSILGQAPGRPAPLKHSNTLFESLVIQHIKRLHNLLEATHLTRNLPQRVQDTIKKQQDASEIQIGWIQLAFIVTMAILYSVSPRAFSAETMFAPVPWAIFVYLLFTITRVILAHLRRLPRWLLWVSVVIDMTLLLGLIWTFHIQYEQPPSFYLKSPTLLYVFIFISIRALRFDPGFVILSGAVAAIGWLCMVGYAILFNPEAVGITRDYAEYMTSNYILLGAEFDKIISIIVVTLILSIGITRARRRLVEAATEQSAAQDLSRFLPEQVVEQVTNSATRLEAGFCESRVATILYFDIETFTNIGERLSPGQLVKTLNDYFTAVSEPINRRGGIICQFQGDAILACFNLPKADSDHANNAILAGIDILELLRNRRFGDGVSLSVRVGINTGTVVGGLVGTPRQLGYTVHGNDVNLAARLEQLNKETGTRLLISESTWISASKSQTGFKPLGEFQLRGQSRTVPVYTLINPASDC